MNYKVIDEKDYQKAFEHISFYKHEETFEGCLFVYDDNFEEEFENIHNRMYPFDITWNLERLLEFRSSSKCKTS